MAIGDLILAHELALTVDGLLVGAGDVIGVGRRVRGVFGWLGAADGADGLGLFEGGGLETEVRAAEAELGRHSFDHAFDMARLVVGERGGAEQFEALRDRLIEVVGGVCFALELPVLEEGAVERVLEEIGVEGDADAAAFGALDEEAEDLGFAVGGDGLLDAGAAEVGFGGDRARGAGAAGAARAGDELEREALIDAAEAGEALDVVGADDGVDDRGDGGGERLDGAGAGARVSGFDLTADGGEEVIGDRQGPVEQLTEGVRVLTDQ